MSKLWEEQVSKDKKIPKSFFNLFTSMSAEILAPIIAPTIPDTAIVIPIFQLINFCFIFSFFIRNMYGGAGQPPL